MFCSYLYGVLREKKIIVYIKKYNDAKIQKSIGPSRVSNPRKCLNNMDGKSKLQYEMSILYTALTGFIDWVLIKLTYTYCICDRVEFS